MQQTTKRWLSMRQYFGAVYVDSEARGRAGFLLLNANGSIAVLEQPVEDCEIGL